MDKYAIVDFRTPKYIIDSLKRHNITVFKSFNNKNVAKPVCGHTDMQLCMITDKNYVCAPECYDYYKAIFDKLSLNLIKGERFLSCNYPKDSAYNIARVGNYAFHNFKCTDEVVLNELAKNNIKRININQGYSKCSICIVCENAIITSDNMAAKQAERCGIHALVIKNGEVDLPGYDYGFIGGASGLFRDELYFAGDISLNSNFENISSFCDKNYTKIISLSKDKLLDIGSIVFL